VREFMVVLARTLAAIVCILAGGIIENFSVSHPGGDQIARRTPIARAAQRVSLQNIWARKSTTLSGSPRLENSGRSAISEIGRGKGIVFSPDLSEPGNRAFYRALGFAYFEDPDWHSVLKQIREFNQTHPDESIETLLIQSHGTNGDAMKLQTGNQPDAPRSYISPGGLLEQLGGTGVSVCLLAACNAGRLFRPENYQSVKADEGNHLFEPATLGVINASPNFDPERSRIAIARRAESHIEVINECRISEFSAATRAALINNGSDSALKPSVLIAVPEMLIQLLLTDERLHLVTEGLEVEKSRAETPDSYREHLIARFLRFVDGAAAKDRQPSNTAKQADYQAF
jgi:hypothetical protein